MDFDIKQSLIQACINAGIMCIVLLVKHIVNIRICKSKCNCFGHRLVEIDNQVTVGTVENV